MPPSASSRRPAEAEHHCRARRVNWKYFYAEGKRHLTEAVNGYRCALCHVLCRSFTVGLLGFWRFLVCQGFCYLRQYIAASPALQPSQCARGSNRVAMKEII